MAVITPQTDIWLLKVPLEISDMNQLTFASKQAQYNYFNSLPKLQAGDYTYQRKDGTIRYAGQFDDVITYNYVMYRNDAYSDKWFYAFITDTQYISDGMTAITIKTDVWQTWQFDLTFKPCLIDREHTNDDSIGSNTLPEGLELGEFVTNGAVQNFGGAGTDYCIVVEVSQVENPGESQTMWYDWASGSHTLTPSINSLDRGTIPLVIGLREGAGNTAGGVIEQYDRAGLSDSVVNVYILPKSLIGSNYNAINIITYDYNTGEALTNRDCVVPAISSGVFNLGNTTFSRPGNIAGYVPKNNKLFTYPYCYFNISNNAGTSIPYHYEDFNGNITFKSEGVFCPSSETKAIPLNYKNIDSSENALDYSISGAKYPICSWKSDSYTNWLTQNAINLNTQWKTTLTSVGVATAGGAIRGGISGGLKGAGLGAGIGLMENGGSLIALAREQHLAKTAANMVSDQVHGNLGAGDFVWSKYKTPFTYLPMSIKPEYARCIDGYFQQFGYKCNRVKVPNITGRRNWNYVKTVGCYIDGDIPQSDMQEIKNMFDRGITLWHNPLQFANYGADNDII